jgi:hypothetical protein
MCGKCRVTENVGSVTKQNWNVIQGITGSQEEVSGNTFTFGLTKWR